MKIVSLNCWGGKLYDELISYLVKSNADIICLQEVVHTPAANNDWLTYKDGNHILSQRANFYRDVENALPDHFGTFCPAAQGVLWDNDIKIPSQWGLATFVCKSLPIIEQIQGFVHKSFSPHSYGEHPRSRSAHVIRVFDYDKNCPIVVAHMHGLRDLNGKMDTPERITQVHNFISMVRSILKNEDPLIVCGDFNVGPDSETLKVLSEAGLTDLVTTRTSKGTRTSYYKKLGKYADYMMVNNKVKVSDFNVIRSPEVSDHCPIELVI